jgi:hypothetical protein
VTWGGADPRDKCDAVVYVLMKDDAIEQDIVRAYIRAYILRVLLWKEGYDGEQGLPFRTIRPARDGQGKRQHRMDLVQLALNVENTDQAAGFRNFVQNLEFKIQHDHDWKVSSSLLETRYARIGQLRGESIITS